MDINRFQAPASVRYARSWQDLVSTTQSHETELVLWKRDPLPAQMDLSAPDISDFEIIIGAQAEIFAGFPQLFEEAAWPAALREIIAQDVHGFTRAAEAKLPGAQYRLRLHAVSDDACRKFHQDRTFQRLIITYRGLGTCWRRADDPAEHAADEMDCVLLRGKRNGRETHILHKSPIFPSGEPPRLMMVLDVIPSDVLQ